jgi:hypothetical protein
LKLSSHFLWQLIGSLSRNEKLFFKRNFTSSDSLGEQRLYLKLFDAIAAQREYDEGAILKKFHPHLTKKNIAFQKHYLQRQVCEAIIQYDGRNSIVHDIYNQILLIRVYRKKGLADEAHHIWKKAVEKARKSESYALLNLLKTEFEKMILFSGMHTHYDDMHAVFKDHIITYKEYADLITLRDIYTETLLLKRKAHFDLDDELNEKIAFLLAKVNEEKAAPRNQSFWYRHYYSMSKATLLYLVNDINGSLILLQEVFKDWKKNKDFIRTDGEYYIELLYMTNYAGILQGAYKYVTDVFNDEINELLTDPVLRANFEATKYLALNKIYNKTARYDEVEKLCKFMKAKYKQWEPVLNADLNRTVNLSLGIACFVLEQYPDAYYFTKRSVTEFREGAREDQIAVAQILLLLITYSLDSARLFDAQYRTTYGYFYKRKKKHPFEAALVQCLHRTFYLQDTKSKIREYEKALEVFDLNQDDIVQKMAFSIFNYPGWLISKVRRISYRQYVEKKVKEIA